MSVVIPGDVILGDHGRAASAQVVGGRRALDDLPFALSVRGWACRLLAVDRRAR